MKTNTNVNIQNNKSQVAISMSPSNSFADVYDRANGKGEVLFSELDGGEFKVKDAKLCNKEGLFVVMAGGK